MGTDKQQDSVKQALQFAVYQKSENERKGGWKIMRARTDKNANPLVIADKIWATIAGYDIKKDLYEVLQNLRPEFFTPKVSGTKR